jgi:hypothetical protein
MFDLRYHVASLAAVFLALIIGILVGVGISDRGLVDSAKTKFLQDQVASLQHRLDNQATQSTDLSHERQAAQTFINETYPALVRNKLKGRQIAVVYIGSDKGSTGQSVDGALTDAGAEQLRLRSLTVPIDLRRVQTALKNQPAADGLRGRKNLEALGRALGLELVQGGDTPLWNSLTDSLVEHRDGGTQLPADGVVVIRTAPPQKKPASTFLRGLYGGLASTPAPAVGVEQADDPHSAIDIFHEAGLSTVDDVDTRVGRLALVLLLGGASPGQYGVKDSAGDGALPPLPTTQAAASG